MESAKNNLVVVRAGKDTLHNHWLDLAPENRSWDLVVSYFDQEAFDDHIDQPGVTKVFLPGGKWSGLYDAVVRFDALKKYEYFWFPDDDIFAYGSDINKMFEVAKEWKLELCQPALRPASFYFHFIVTHCPAFDLRFTNFAEVMLPCLSRSHLELLLPIFENRHTGVGLDLLWAAPELTLPNSVAILDNVVMTHTRPLGSALRGVVSKLGQPQTKMRDQLLVDFGIERRPPQVALGGVVNGVVTNDVDEVYRLMHKSYSEKTIDYQNPARAMTQNAEMLAAYRDQIGGLSELALPREEFLRKVREERAGIVKDVPKADEPKPKPAPGKPKPKKTWNKAAKSWIKKAVGLR